MRINRKGLSATLRLEVRERKALEDALDVCRALDHEGLSAPASELATLCAEIALNDGVLTINGLQQLPLMPDVAPVEKSPVEKAADKLRKRNAAEATA